MDSWLSQITFWIFVIDVLISLEFPFYSMLSVDSDIFLLLSHEASMTQVRVSESRESKKLIIPLSLYIRLEFIKLESSF